MIGTLMESRRVAKRRVGGSIASLATHILVIAAAVMGTDRTPAAPPPPDDIIVKLVPLRPVAPPKAPPADGAASSSAPRDVVVSSAPPRFDIALPDAPILTPTSIPAIDFTATPTDVDFNERRAKGAQGACRVGCAVIGGDQSGSDGSSWSANEAVMRLRDKPAPPRYPETLRRAGVEGDVLVKFVVDTLGRVDTRTVEVIRSTHELFTLSVRESLGQLRFDPAVAGNRRVPAAAMMPFQFTLRK